MIKFKNKEHGKFYEQCLGLCGCSDPYHKAFFYTMGISSETRMHIHDCFNFRDDVSRVQGVCGAVNPDPVLVSHIVLPSKGDGGRLNGRPPSPLRILLGSGQRTP